MQRTRCVACRSDKLELLRTVPDFPLNSNSEPSPTLEDRQDMLLGTCTECHQIQLLQLAELKKLYKGGHNASIIGELWQNHYKELSKFILDNIPLFTSSRVLDIGDPNYKVARELLGFHGEWIAMDPNCRDAGPQGNWGWNGSVKLTSMRTFFDDKFDSKLEVDVVLHSHLFEHIYTPLDFLEQVRRILTPDGYMCFSVPNMQHIGLSGAWPFTGVFLEHTYHLSEHCLRYMLHQTGFKIVSTRAYGNHSTFYLVKKATEPATSASLQLDLALLTAYNVQSLGWFASSLDVLQKLIHSVETAEAPIYVYGAHYLSQVLLQLLGGKVKVLGIIDKDPAKQGKYLTGSSSPTYGLEIIPTVTERIVIGHCGLYKDEIYRQLRALNSTVKLVQ